MTIRVQLTFTGRIESMPIDKEECVDCGTIAEENNSEWEGWEGSTLCYPCIAVRRRQRALPTWLKRYAGERRVSGASYVMGQRSKEDE